MKRLRLLPIVLTAACCLLLLKGVHLIAGDQLGWTDDATGIATPVIEPEPAPEDLLAERFRAGDPLDLADLTDQDEEEIDPIVTGQTDGESSFGFQLSDGLAAAAARRAAALRSSRTSDSNVREVILGQDPESELAILERLSDRRKELEARTDQLELRENLLQAAEKRIEERINELQRLEGQIDVKIEQRNDEQKAQLASLVQMYESMKPKDAAKIFDRLDLDILVRVVEEMKPRKMSAVMAKMTPDVAKQLTTAIALRSLASQQAPAPTNSAVSDLPQINGELPASGG